MIAPMMLAGIRVRDQDVLELAQLLRDENFEEVAERLENAYEPGDEGTRVDRA